jgi:hypothetical protein
MTPKCVLLAAAKLIESKEEDFACLALIKACRSHCLPFTTDRATTRFKEMYEVRDSVVWFGKIYLDENRRKRAEAPRACAATFSWY